MSYFITQGQEGLDSFFPYPWLSNIKILLMMSAERQVVVCANIRCYLKYLGLKKCAKTKKSGRGMNIFSQHWINSEHLTLVKPLRAL